MVDNNMRDHQRDGKSMSMMNHAMTPKFNLQDNVQHAKELTQNLCATYTELSHQFRIRERSMNVKSKNWDIQTLFMV